MIVTVASSMGSAFSFLSAEPHLQLSIVLSGMVDALEQYLCVVVCLVFVYFQYFMGKVLSSVLSSKFLSAGPKCASR